MDAKKEKTRRESSPIKVWVTPDEKSAIRAKGGANSLSASSYLRRLGLALSVESTIDRRAILDLVKINADLGRYSGRCQPLQVRYGVGDRWCGQRSRHIRSHP